MVGIVGIMSRILLLVLICLSAGTQADPFNIYLPFKTQYVPSALEKLEMAFVIDIERKRKNFQLQINPQTGGEQFIEGRAADRPRLSFGFALGLGKGFDAEVGVLGGAAFSALKYNFGMKNSSWKHSVVLSRAYAEDYGHGGSVLPEEDSCGFLDLGCFFSGIFDIFSIFGSPDDRYEYDYLAKVNALSLVYLQGYQLSPRTTAFWSVNYTEYSVDVQVTDNTGAGNNQTGFIKTDMAALVLGMQWKLGKKEHNYNKSMILNIVTLKDSLLHDGELNNDIKLSYILGF